MADYGLRILSASLDVQIDGTYNNYSLYFDGNEYQSHAGNIAVGSMGNVHEQSPLTSLKLMSATPLVVDYHYAGGVVVRTNSNHNFDLEWQTFLEGMVLAPDYGLVVRNASGNAVFSSEDKHMTIVDSYIATLVDTFQGASKNITVRDADNNYFICEPPAMIKIGIPTDEYRTRGFKKLNATTIRAVTMETDGLPVSGAGNAWPATINIIEIRKE